jgi:hypothetical protein
MELLLCKNMIKSLYLTLEKCHEHLHPFVISFVDEDFLIIRIVVWIFWSILQVQVNQQKKLVKRELLIFRHYQLCVKTSNIFFNGGRNMKRCFLLLISLILNIIGS